MAATLNHVLARIAGGLQKVYLAVTGGSVAQAGLVVQTGTDGFIDDSMIHPTLVPGPISLPAAVAIRAGKQVNIFNNGGTESVQLADATLATPLRSDGFVLAAVALSATAKVYRRGGVNTALTGLTRDTDYYLGAGTTAGGDFETQLIAWLQALTTASPAGLGLSSSTTPTLAATITALRQSALGQSFRILCMKRLATALLASTALALPAYGQTAADTGKSNPLPNSGFSACYLSGAPGLCAFVPGTGLVSVRLAPLQMISLARSIDAHFTDELNPKDAPFYATGNGSTDDTAALQAWAAAISSIGGHGVLPCGSYKLTSTLLFNASNVDVRGYGVCSQLNYYGTGDAVKLSAVTASQPGAAMGNARMNNFEINGMTSQAATAGVGMRLQNQSDTKIFDVPINSFWRGTEIDGGNDIQLINPFFRGSSSYTKAAVGAAAIDIEPIVASGTSYASNSVHIVNHDIGGSDSGSFMEAGLRIAAADGVFMTTGHIGQVQNDVEFARIAGQNIQSVEIKGYLDGSLRAVYFAPPSGSAPDGGAGSVNIVLAPFQIDNQTGNAVESQDPTADFTLSGAMVSHVAGWGVYAPYAAKVGVFSNRFDLVGYGSGMNAGGVSAGIVAGNGAAGTGTAGAVGGAVVANNQFYNTAACIFTANLGEGLSAMNLTNDCTSGKPGSLFDKVTAGSLTVTGPTSLNTVLLPNGGSVDSAGNLVLGGGATMANATVNQNLSLPNGSVNAAGNLGGGSFSVGGVAGASCSGVPSASARWVNGIRTNC